MRLIVLAKTRISQITRVLWVKYMFKKSVKSVSKKIKKISYNNHPSFEQQTCYAQVWCRARGRLGRL